MEKIGLDKVLHFVLSFTLSAVLSLVACYFLPENPVLNGVIAVTVAALLLPAAILTELGIRNRELP